MLKKCLLISFLLPFMAISADEETQKAEKILRQFCYGVLTKNKVTITNTSIYNHKAEILWHGSRLTGTSAQLKANEVNKTEIEWKQSGDSMRLQGSEVNINDNMVNSKRKIAIFKHVDIKVPISMLKLPSGEWRVNPLWLIMTRSKDLARQEKEAIADYRVIIDGKVHQMDLEKNNKITLADGKTIEVRLEQNANLRFHKGGLQLFYPKEMKAVDYIKKNSTLLQLTSDLSVSALVEVTPDTVKAQDILQRYIKAYRENFQREKALFEKESLREIKRKVAGQEYPAYEMNVNIEGKVIRNIFSCFQKDGRNIMIYLRSSQEDYVAAQGFFDRILNRLEVY